jgi:hypothetical protein
MSDHIDELANQINEQATVLSEAYRLRLLGRLWWANLSLVVLPAVLATAAAIFAASGAGRISVISPYAAAWLAGGAAVLTAIHKALKCEEYQAECLRLGQAYQAIAIEAQAARSGPDVHRSVQELAKKFAGLAEGSKAPLPDTYIARAEERTGYKLHRRPSASPVPTRETASEPAGLTPSPTP